MPEHLKLPYHLGDGVYLEKEGYVALRDNDGSILLKQIYTERIDSLTFSSGAKLSMTESGLVRRSANGQVTKCFYSITDTTWIKEDATHRPSSKCNETWEPTELVLPQGCGIMERHIPVHEGSLTASSGTVAHALPIGDLLSGGHYLHQNGRHIPCGVEELVEGDEFDVRTTMGSEGNSYLVCWDKLNKCRYIYSHSCKPSSSTGSWSEIYLTYPRLEPSGKKQRRFSLGLFFVGVFVSALCSFALWGIYRWLGHDFSLLALALPVEFYIACFLYNAAVLAVFPFDTLKASRRAFAFSIGPYRFNGNGSISASGTKQYFTDEFLMVVDGYVLTSSGDSDSVVIQRDEIQATIRLDEGMVVAENFTFHRLPEDLRTPYCPRSGFNVFEPNRENDNFYFQAHESDVGFVHQNYRGALQTSMDIGGAVFTAAGHLNVGDTRIDRHEGMSQRRFGEILICKYIVDASIGQWCVRIVHLGEDLSWFRSYLSKESHQGWEPWIWTKHNYSFESDLDIED